MESCFPPLANLRGSSNSTNSSSSSASTNKHQKYRHSLGGGVGLASNDKAGSGGGGGTDCSNGSRDSDYIPKLEVIQDLDLYYIRQIACSLKVRIMNGARGGTKEKSGCTFGFREMFNCSSNIGCSL